MDRKQRSQITTGLLLIALGLILLAHRLALLPQMDLHRLWPVFLLILGAARVYAPGEDGRRGGGAWMIFLGILFLLHTYSVFRLSQSWPLFIVAGGVSILFGRGDVKVGGRTRPPRGDEAAASQGAAGVPPVDGGTHGR